MERRASAPDIRPAVRRMINESMAQKKSPFSMTYATHYRARRNRVTPRCHTPSEATGANTITSKSSTCEAGVRRALRQWTQCTSIRKRRCCPDTGSGLTRAAVRKRA